MAVEMTGEILEVLQYLEGIFSAQFGVESAKGFITALADIDLISLRAGAVWIAKNNRFLPRLAEIRSAAVNCKPVSMDALITRREQLRYVSFRPNGFENSAWDALYNDCWSAGYWEMAKYIETLKARYEKNLLATQAVQEEQLKAHIQAEKMAESEAV